jgi:hypothetical protein
MYDRDLFSESSVFGLLELAELLEFALDDAMLRSSVLKTHAARILGAGQKSPMREVAISPVKWADLPVQTNSIVPISGGIYEALEFATISECQLNTVISVAKRIRVQIPAILNRGHLGATHYLSMIFTNPRAKFTYRDLLNHAIAAYHRRFSMTEIRNLMKFTRSFSSSR